jgi:hypothetical protein
MAVKVQERETQERLTQAAAAAAARKVHLAAQAALV